MGNHDEDEFSARFLVGGVKEGLGVVEVGEIGKMWGVDEGMGRAFSV